MLYLELIVLAIFIALMALGKFRTLRSQIFDFLETLENICSKPRVFFSLAALILFFGGYLGFHSLAFLKVDGGQELRLFFSYCSPINNIFSSYDIRHPGLYFAIIHWPLILTDFSVWHVRSVGVLFYLASIILAGLVAKRWTGSIGAVLGMIMLSIWPEFIERSREITPFSLFIMFGILSILFYQRYLDTGKTREKLIFSVVLGVTLYTSYAAVVLLMAFLLHILIDSERRRQLSHWLVFTVFIGSPIIFRYFSMIPGEMESKKLALLQPNYNWGNWSVIESLKTSFLQVFTSSLPLAASLIFLVAVAANFGKLRVRGILVILLLLNGAFPLLSSIVKFKPYYALFFSAAFTLLYSSLVFKAGEPGAGFMDYLRRLAALVGILVILLSLGLDLHRRWDSLYPQSDDNIHTVKPFVDTIIGMNGQSVVIDIDYDVHLITYFFFDRPYETWRNTRERNLKTDSCLFFERGYSIICKDAGSERRVLALTRHDDLSGGWQARSKELLIRTLNHTDVFFIYNKYFPNKTVLEFLKVTCVEISTDETYILFSCKRPL